MSLVCWSVKGGSGTTVVASALAVLLAGDAATTLVDLGGDVVAALGVDHPGGPGVGDWLSAPNAAAAALARLPVPVAANLSVIGPGAWPPAFGEEQSARLARALHALPGATVVDAGPHLDAVHALAAAGARSLLVVRPCYLALRRGASAARPPADGAVVVREPARALGPADVQQTLGVPVVATIEWDPAIARAVDAGLLTARMPRSLHPLRRAA